jgi:hypothetical protein
VSPATSTERGLASGSKTRPYGGGYRPERDLWASIVLLVEPAFAVLRASAAPEDPKATLRATSPLREALLLCGKPEGHRLAAA